MTQAPIGQKLNCEYRKQQAKEREKWCNKMPPASMLRQPLHKKKIPEQLGKSYNLHQR